MATEKWTRKGINAGENPTVSALRENVK